jgi:PAS domain S-box-containing protein
MPLKSPRLSVREREIVDLAARGHTDAGIANKLGISTATVGTYWNRIRSKVGPYSRTQVVAFLLLEDSQRTIQNLKASSEEMLAQVSAGRVQWKEVFANAPDAMMVVAAPGVITEANDEAAALFGYSPGELDGLPIDALLPHDKSDLHERHVTEYFGSHERKKMADHVGTAALRKDGTEFLIAADLKGFEVEGTTMVVCIVRPVVA